MFQKVLQGLSNPKVQKIIITGLIVIAILVVISKASGGAKKFFNKLVYGIQGDEPYAHITDARKLALEKMAGDVKGAIYGTSGFGGVADRLTELNALNDAEFAYVVEHYEKFVSENKLYYDIDWEVMPFDDIDDTVLARLSRMNLV